MSFTLAAGMLASAMVLASALPASAASGDWEEYDHVGGLTSPSGVAAMEGSPTLLYVTEPDASAIAVLDADTLDVVDTVSFPGMTPTMIEVDQSTGVVYFVDDTAWAIVRWDPAVTPVTTTQIVIGSTVGGLTVNSNLPDPSDPVVFWTVVDDGTGHGQVVAAPADLSTSSDLDLGAGVEPAGLSVYTVLSDPNDPTSLLPIVLVADPANDQILLATLGVIGLPVGASPVDIELLVGESGPVLFATANFDDDTATVIDAAASSVNEVPVGDGPTDVDVSEIGGPIFVVNSGSGTVSVIPSPYSAAGWTIPVGAGAFDGAYSSTLARYFVAAPGSGAVVSIARTPAAAPELAATGFDTLWPLLAAMLLVLGGGAVVLASRRQSRLAAD
jgi:DNA-binding beta-propeller fold protein YncE